jgi:hypothetical protein
MQALRASHNFSGCMPAWGCSPSCWASHAAALRLPAWCLAVASAHPPGVRQPTRNSYRRTRTIPTASRLVLGTHNKLIQSSGHHTQLTTRTRISLSQILFPQLPQQCRTLANVQTELKLPLGRTTICGRLQTCWRHVPPVKHTTAAGPAHGSGPAAQTNLLRGTRRSKRLV